MDSAFFKVFDNWRSYIQKMDDLSGRLHLLLTDLGIAPGEVRILAFISSAWRGEIKLYDSNGSPSSSQQYIKRDDKHIIEDHLTNICNIKKEQAIFTFDSYSTYTNAYDEFGIIPQGSAEVRSCGIILEYHQLRYSKIVFELLNQISLFYKNLLDDEKFEIQEYMLANIVYVALKKQIDIDLYNTLAAIPYEKRVASGGIVLIHGEQQGNLKIHFKEDHALDIKNMRQIRKLLEITTDTLFLISKNGKIIGIGDAEDCDSDDVDLFRFNGHQMWSYYKNGKELLAYKEGKYTFIFGMNINFISHFPNNFIAEHNYEHLNIILHEIRQKNRGTLLIISDEAQKEAERLCKFGRGYAIMPVDLKLPGSKNLLSSIISIDGAIFIDTNFICYGLGVILDGITVKPGLSSRGARYNSAQCYIDNKEHGKFSAVIISDDETIDIISN